MSTIRSHYRFEQFREVLRGIAHETAREIVEGDLPTQGYMKIINHNIREIGTDKLSIKFYSKRVKVEKKTAPHNRIIFEIEEKMYTTSNHSSKISFEALEGEEAEKEKQVQEYIDGIMSQAGVTPVARFSLEDYTAP